MIRKSSCKKESPGKRCGNPTETALRFGLGEEKLRKMRFLGQGPEYRIAGHRSIVYDWEKVEDWLNSLPKGGAGVPGSAVR
jgi:hypothetical protein